MFLKHMSSFFFVFLLFLSHYLRSAISLPFSSDLSHVWPVDRQSLVEQLYTFMGAKVKVTR